LVRTSIVGSTMFESFVSIVLRNGWHGTSAPARSGEQCDSYAEHQ
jgi:hypothetical protein